MVIKEITRDNFLITCIREHMPWEGQQIIIAPFKDVREAEEFMNLILKTTSQSGNSS